MKAYKIYIPQQFDDGRAIPTVSIEEFLQRALELFGEYVFNPMPLVVATGEQTEFRKAFTLEVVTDGSPHDHDIVFKYAEHIKEAFNLQFIRIVEVGKVIELC